jgi:cell division protein ZipA
MDLSVRDWLIVIGALLALAVLLDGYRRMHKDRRDTIRLTPKARRDVDEDLINPELPSSARVIAVREEKSLHLKRAVDSRPAKPPRHEPTVATEETEDDNNILFTDPAEEYNPKLSAGIDEDEDRDVAAGWSNSGDDFDAEDVTEELPRHSEKPVIEDRPSSVENKTHKTAQATSSPHQELLVLNVMAQDKSPFKGSDLLQILMACDVRYGKMNIFHRYENADGSGEVQFSVANLVEPGNFDLDEIEGFTTPGVVFFMHLPGPRDSVKAYEAMVETAKCLVKNLNGELRDQSHSVATKQTLEHYKQRIRDFERRQLTLM